MPVQYDVLVVGDASLDFIFTDLPHLPRLGEDTLARSFQMVPGESYNTTVALHRLGVKTAWAANFGNDPLSKIILDHCEKEGLDHTFFVHHPKSFLRVSVSASIPGERGFLSYYDPEPAIPAAIPALPKINAKYLFIPGFLYGTLLEAALPVVKLKKMKIIMDGNTSEPITLNQKAVQRALRAIEVFTPNERELLRLAETDNLEEALHRTAAFCPLVVVKAGADGSYAMFENTIYHQPAIKVKVVDTTGAGDCFDAGFIKAWLDGKPIEECLLWGNIVGGLSTQGHGAAGEFIDTHVVEKTINMVRK
jgi:sugar/nucleoside kinase (ribokinase family)